MNPMKWRDRGKRHFASTDEYHLTTVQIEGTQNSERFFEVDMDTLFLNQTCPIMVVDA